jgi:capsular exopolysaccharide synthesis family protein
VSRVFEAAAKADEKNSAVEKSEAIAETAKPALKDSAKEATPAPEPLPRYRTVPIELIGPSQLLPFNSQDPFAGERYRILRTRIAHHPKQARTLCISSTSPRDGKSVTAINLATSLALKKNTNVLLVDVDLRRPQLARFLGIPEEPGVADLLSGNSTLEEVIVRIERFPNLHVLPAGRPIGNPAELLDSEQWRKAAVQFRQEFDYTVMDSPPIGPVADYDLIQTVCEGVILVVRPGHTSRSLLQRGIDHLNDRFMGAVINCAEDWLLWHSQDGSYYYRYAEEPRPKS